METWTFFPAWVLAWICYAIVFKAWQKSKTNLSNARIDLSYARSEVRTLQRRVREFEEREAKNPRTEPGSGGPADEPERSPWGTPPEPYRLDAQMKAAFLTPPPEIRTSRGLIQIEDAVTGDIAEYRARVALRKKYGHRFDEESLESAHDITTFGSPYPIRGFFFTIRGDR